MSYIQVALAVPLQKTLFISTLKMRLSPSEFAFAFHLVTETLLALLFLKKHPPISILKK